MSEASRDQNHVPTALGVSSVDSVTPTPFVINPVTGRLLTDVSGGGSGTVTSVSVVSANGFAGSVATATTTPAITLTTTITGILKGNGTAISAATDGTDYLSSTTGLKLDQTSAQTITNDTPIFNTLTASELVATTAAKKLQSLAVATYPSLTELSYVKGVTSAIQTQINAKGTGNVSKVGTPVDNQVGVWTGDGTIEGSTTLTFDGDILTVTNNNDTASATALVVQGDRLNPTAYDEVIIEMRLSDSAGNQDTMGTIRAQALDVTSTSEYSQLKFGTVIAGTLASRLALTGTELRPNTDDALSLGNATANRWSDLFLAEGGVINWDNGDATITQTGNVLAVAGADLRVATADVGTNADSVPTLSSTNTFTNKRIQPRTASSTTSSNLSPDLSTANVYYRTTQTATLTIDAPTGTPVIGEVIMIYVDSAGAQTLTIDSTYKPFGAAFPATTTAGKTFMMSAQYNGTDWKTLWAVAV